MPHYPCSRRITEGEQAQTYIALRPVETVHLHSALRLVMMILRSSDPEYLRDLSRLPQFNIGREKYAR